MFAKIKIGVRIQITLSVMLLVVLALGLNSTHELRDAADSDALLFERGAKPMSLLGEYRVDFQNGWSALILAASAKDRVSALREPPHPPFPSEGVSKACGCA